LAEINTHSVDLPPKDDLDRGNRDPQRGTRLFERDISIIMRPIQLNPNDSPVRDRKMPRQAIGEMCPPDKDFVGLRKPTNIIDNVSRLGHRSERLSRLLFFVNGD